MSEMAFNVNGEPFEVPAAATGWRVRKLKQKGAPEVVYGRDGLPLVLPVDAELDDLRREVGTPGRYRLDPVDQGNRPIPAAPAGYVFIHATDQEPSSETSAGLVTHTDNVAIEAMRMNAEIAKSVVDRFPLMMEAAANLLRAADGAGLPARQRVVEEVEEEDDGGSEPDLNSLIAQIVPMVVAGLSGKKMPKLETLLDWRKATSRKTAPSKTDTEALPPIDPATMAHFMAVQAALTPEEADIARATAAELAPAELRSWFQELADLSVPDAVAKIRSVIGGAA